MWDSRFQYVSELEKMGAKITVNGQVAVIEGGNELTAADVCATDLRAGAGMVIAALCAHGKSSIGNIHHIDRGYENIEEKLISLGAKIIRADD